MPEILRVYREDDVHDLGVWTMSIEWRTGSTERARAQTTMYDIQIFHTEQMRLIHEVRVYL